MKDEDKSIEEFKNAIMELEKVKIESIDIFRKFIISNELECFIENFKGNNSYEISNKHDDPPMSALSKTDIGKKVAEAIKLITDRWSNVIKAGINCTTKSIMHDLDSQAISLFLDIASEEGVDINKFFRLLITRLHEVSDAKGNRVIQEALKEAENIFLNYKENKDDSGSVVLH